MIQQSQFEMFDRANPEIYRLFKHYTFTMIHTGRVHYSARAIIHRIRWDTDLRARGEDGFKINNDYSPFYARKFEQEHPEHAGFFLKRRSGADLEVSYA